MSTYTGGWMDTSHGYFEINKVEQFRKTIKYIPIEKIAKFTLINGDILNKQSSFASFSENLFSRSNPDNDFKCDYFEYSKDGGDSWYPRGNYTINFDKFRIALTPIDIFTPLKI